MNLLQMLSSKDINFVGYTYKNFEIVNDHQLPGIGSVSFAHDCIYVDWVSSQFDISELPNAFSFFSYIFIYLPINSLSDIPKNFCVMSIMA